MFNSGAGELLRVQGAIDARNDRNFITLYSTNPSYHWEISNQDAGGGGMYNGLAFNEVSDGVAEGTRVYLAQGGNVGVGTNAPAALFHVAGETQIDGNLHMGGRVAVNSSGQALYS